MIPPGGLDSTHDTPAERAPTSWENPAPATGEPLDAVRRQFEWISVDCCSLRALRISHVGHRAAFLVVLTIASCGGDKDDPPEQCGDAALVRSFPACQSAQSEAACTAAGGTWGVYGGVCLCETGQDGCPCTAQGDCVGTCLGRLDLVAGCATVHTGTCSSKEPYLGCWCEFLEPGHPPYGVCNDP